MTFSLKKIAFSLLMTAMIVPALATDADNATRESLISFNDTFNTNAANLDVEGLLSLYDKDAYWIAPGTPPAKGRDGVPRQTVTFLKENNGKLSHTIDDLFISKDGTQAVMMGVTNASVESAGFKLNGTYMYVLKRETVNDPWLIVADMFNNYAEK